MKQIVGTILLMLTLAFALNTPKAMAGPVSGGSWTTGAVGALGDVVYQAGGDYVIDLALEGVYDPVLWVVILDYNTLTIEAGATVRFTNHASRAPVVIRAVGPIVIAGELNLDGADGHTGVETPSYAEPGPGGFRGGIGNFPGTTLVESDGFGPGGGWRTSDSNNIYCGSASHATLGANSSTHGQSGSLYGSGFANPLIGGSGGTACRGLDSNNSDDHHISGGGAGGGALLIGSDSSIDLVGTISAGGGNSGYMIQDGSSEQLGRAAGSGGAIRVASPVITWQGAGDILTTRGGESLGGHGWIRVETNGTPVGGAVPSFPAAFHSTTLGEFLPNTLPTVSLVAVLNKGTGEWVPIDQDPRGVFENPGDADVRLGQTGLRIFKVEGHGVPLGSPLHIRVAYANGLSTTDSTHTMGTVTGSTLATSWTNFTLDFSAGAGTIQIRAELP